MLVLNSAKNASASYRDDLNAGLIKSIPAGANSSRLDLSPAQWLWYPSQRCLQNTFVLFRKEIQLDQKPVRTRGWILGESRYLLFVNGARVQWGPAPCDPRWPEADPFDLADHLKPGKNIIGAQVLFYGQGDGTWPIGKPGFIFFLELELPGGQIDKIVSDSTWQCHLARSWQPGHYKRWYLRSLQEEFDARLYPYGWTEPSYQTDENWLPAMALNCPADKPVLCANYSEYMLEIQGDLASTELRARSIPMLEQVEIPAEKLAESHWLSWNRPPEEYFESLTPDAVQADWRACAEKIQDGPWQVKLDGSRAAVLTFEFKEQIVGWPYFTIEAPAGTIIELMVQEAHEPGAVPLINNHYHSWTRFTCKDGVNHFETFDYESLRWLQLHIRNARATITVKNVGVRRRIFPWPQQPQISCSDNILQKLIDASINTLHNSAQETIVDGMGRERQQYSGDCGHQLHAIYNTFGETGLPARYITTFSQGLTLDGYFLDCWPAYDRLARLMERQLHLTKWGPLLDHGIGFNFDCLYHYLYSGDLASLNEGYPRLLRFFQYLLSIRQENGLLPVENIGVPAVWIDHEAYNLQRHKQCAFNLYAAAMAGHALAPLCRAFGDLDWEQEVIRFGQELLVATREHFWSEKHGLYVNNRPWLAEEKTIRLCDRSLATSILFDQCPAGIIEPALKALADCPPELGFSYPANAGWRLWALARGGRIDVVINDLRDRWGKMASVHQNNTLQENWTARPDSGAQWSHCPVVPLYIVYMNIAGIMPLEPGFNRYQIQPQLGDINQLEITAHTVKGPIVFKATGNKGNRKIAIKIPTDGIGEFVVHAREKIDLKEISFDKNKNLKRYKLAKGDEIHLVLKYT